MGKQPIEEKSVPDEVLSNLRELIKEQPLVDPEHLAAESRQLRALLLKKYDIDEKEWAAITEEDLMSMVETDQDLQEGREEKERNMMAAAFVIENFHVGVFSKLIEKYRDVEASDPDHLDMVMTSFAKDLIQEKQEFLAELRIYGVYVMRDPQVTRLLESDTLDTATRFFVNLELVEDEHDRDEENIQEFIKSVKEDWQEIFVTLGDAILRSWNPNHISSYSLMN